MKGVIGSAALAVFYIAAGLVINRIFYRQEFYTATIYSIIALLFGIASLVLVLIFKINVFQYTKRNAVTSMIASLIMLVISEIFTLGIAGIITGIVFSIWTSYELCCNAYWTREKFAAVMLNPINHLTLIALLFAIEILTTSDGKIIDGSMIG